MSARCPKCGEPVSADDKFCESCGTELSPAGAPAPVDEPAAADVPAPADVPAIANAGEVHAAPRRCTCGGEIDADGWCTVCGLRAPSERDHFTEQPAPGVAAVSDRGRVHARNEDAVALGSASARTVLVVCDGVTSATDSDVAAMDAARAARDLLIGASDAPPTPPAARAEYWTARIGDAAAAAQAAAARDATRVGGGQNPPSCTFVATVADGPTITTGWVGDSRAYWFGDDGTATQLSVDDSWATEQIAQGIARTVAESDPRAHSITRWLGADSPDAKPSCASMTAAGPGWLLVCTDGLWNYCSDATDLAALLGRCAGTVGADPLALAGQLVAWANGEGGHDNVTAALARIEPRSVHDASVDAPAAAEPSVATARVHPGESTVNT